RVLRSELWLKRELRRLRAADGWTIALIVFGLLAIAIRSWMAAVAFVALLALVLAMARADRRRYRLSAIGETDSLTGWEFERWLEECSRRPGFVVERTPYQRDFGADLIITWHGIKTAVQAKCGHTNVGVSAVQQVVAAKAFYGCERAMVVTNQYFTSEA